MLDRFRAPSTDTTPVRVAIVGLGAIGLAAAEQCYLRPDFEVVAAVDPLKAGGRFHELAIGETLSKSSNRPDVVLVATKSSLEALEEVISQGMELRADVVSTCEELAFPWLFNSELATRLDTTARDGGVRVIGCGVNPGYIMDALPVMLAGSTLNPSEVNVHRSVNLNRRRGQLTEKLGVGLTEEIWQARTAVDKFGHRGLIESAYLCAIGLGWSVQGSSFEREPHLTDGVVTGVRERVHLEVQSNRSVSLDLQFGIGMPDRDVIEIKGSPPLLAEFPNGVQGDDATVARMLNAALTVRGLQPGLRLPIELSSWLPLEMHTPVGTWADRKI